MIDIKIRGQSTQGGARGGKSWSKSERGKDGVASAMEGHRQKGTYKGTRGPHSGPLAGVRVSPVFDVLISCSTQRVMWHTQLQF